jgi:hypothetical protein
LLRRSKFPLRTQTGTPAAGPRLEGRAAKTNFTDNTATGGSLDRSIEPHGFDGHEQIVRDAYDRPMAPRRQPLRSSAITGHHHLRLCGAAVPPTMATIEL